MVQIRIQKISNLHTNPELFRITSRKIDEQQNKTKFVVEG